MWNSYRTQPDIGWIKSDPPLEVGDTVFVNDSELGYHVWITVNDITQEEVEWDIAEFRKGEYKGKEIVTEKVNTAHITVHKGMERPEGAINKSVFID